MSEAERVVFQRALEIVNSSLREGGGTGGQSRSSGETGGQSRSSGETGGQPRSSCRLSRSSGETGGQSRSSGETGGQSRSSGETGVAGVDISLEEKVSFITCSWPIIWCNQTQLSHLMKNFRFSLLATFPQYVQL